MLKELRKIREKRFTEKEERSEKDREKGEEEAEGEGEFWFGVQWLEQTGGQRWGRWGADKEGVNK